MDFISIVLGRPALHNGMSIRKNAVLLKMSAVVMFAIMATSASFAKDVLVDCSGATPGAFVSINAALFGLPLQGPNSITISGTCSEGFTILGFHELTLQGSAILKPPVPNAHIMTIFRSHGIFVKGLTFDGGDVNAYQDSIVRFEGVTVQNSFSSGIASTDSILDIANSSIQNNAANGLLVQGGSVSLDGGVTITKNPTGIYAHHHARLTMSGGHGTPGAENVIGNNSANGVVVAEGSEASIEGDNRIDNNGTGLFVGEASMATMTGGGEIINNAGAGVHITKTSHGEFATLKINGNGSPAFGGGGAMEVIRNSDLTLDGEVEITGNRSNGVIVDESSVFTCTAGNPINNNSGDGVLVEDLAVAHFFGADTITGNGKFSLQCDNSSLVEGDVSNLTHVKCSRISPQ